MSTFKLPLKTFKTYRSWLGRCIVDRRLQRSTVLGPRVKLRWLWYVRWLIRNPETFGYWWTRLAWQAEPTDVSTYPYCFMVSLLSNAYEKIEETIVKTGSTMGFHKRTSREWSWRTYWMKKIQLTVLQVQWFHFKQPSHCIACCLVVTVWLQEMHLSAIVDRWSYCFRGMYIVKTCSNGDKWSECLFYYSFCFFTQRWLVNWFLRIILNSS